jgi:hypothetical protein
MSVSNPQDVTSTMPAVEKPSIGSIVKNGAIAGVGSVVVNAILYFIGAAMGGFPETVIAPTGVPITVGPVILLTIAGAVAGTIGYIALSRFLSKAQADRWFVILASIVLVLMAITPIQLASAGAGALQIILMEIMHVVIGVALMYYLPRSA